jgi:hypothetical protein
VQKLTGISSGQNNKSCSIIHSGPKLVLHFSDFCTIFYTIYNNKENCNTIGHILLQGAPRKDLLFCNVVPGRGAVAVPVKFRSGLARVWPGEGGGAS